MIGAFKAIENFAKTRGQSLVYLSQEPSDFENALGPFRFAESLADRVKTRPE